MGWPKATSSETQIILQQETLAIATQILDKETQINLQDALSRHLTAYPEGRMLMMASLGIWNERNLRVCF